MPGQGIAPSLLRPGGLPQVFEHPAAGAGAGSGCLSGGRCFAPSGDWASGNPAFAVSRGSPGAPPLTPGHGRRFPGMLLSLPAFRLQVSHQIHRHLLQSTPAARAIQQRATWRSRGNTARPSGQDPSARPLNGFAPQGGPASRTARTTLPPRTTTAAQAKRGSSPSPLRPAPATIFTWRDHPPDVNGC